MSIASLYIASGFGVGLLVGMTGVGGGSLMTPLLILLFGIHPGDRRRHRSAVRRRDQDRRQPGARAGAQHPLAGGAAACQRQHSRQHPHAAACCGSSISTAAPRAACQCRALLCADPDRDVADLPQDHPRILSRSPGAARRPHHRPRHRGGRRRARRAGVDLVGRRRRGRRHRVAVVVSAAADGAHRRLRHRACGAADLGRRYRTLGDGRDRLAVDGRAPRGLAARHHPRQLSARPGCRKPRCG